MSSRVTGVNAWDESKDGTVDSVVVTSTGHAVAPSTVAKRVVTLTSN
jgi:hypothetical protein